MNKIKLSFNLFLLALITLLASCKDDEVPVVSVSLESADQEITESDGTLASFHPDLEGVLEDAYGLSGAAGEGQIVKVKLVFDKKLEGEAVIAFSVGGTASSTNPSGDEDVNDYEILSEGENLTVEGNNLRIKKGVTEASILIKVYEDFDYEYSDETGIDETIEITLTSIVSGPVKKLDNQLGHLITIKEDDAFLLLQWMVNGSDEAADVRSVNMDMFVWFDDAVLTGSVYTNDDFAEDVSPIEVVILYGGFPEGDYGVSYIYKEGTSDNVQLTSTFYGNINGELYIDEGVEFTETYTSANVNDWETSKTAKIVQLLTKEGVNFEATQIAAPAEGSRIKALDISERNKVTKSALRRLR